MNGSIKNRFFIMLVVILLSLVLLGVSLGNASLGNMQGSYTEEEMVAPQLETERTVTLKGTRGKILDINGQPLAYNQPSYNVEFLREDIGKRTAEYRPLYTEIMIKTVELIESHGGKTIDSFPILRNENGDYYFDWGTQNEASAKKREENWRKDMRVNDNIETPEEIYLYLRNWLYIPEALDYEQARKILSIWNEVQLNSGTAYKPVTIAYNVSEETVAEIESRLAELDGMHTVRTTMRVYPQGELVAHVIGYTGKVSARENAKAFRDIFGYAYDDRIGVIGIEQSMENYLTGSSFEHHGKKVYEVTRRGEIVRMIDSEAVSPSDGHDVVLTLDMDMQKVATDGLKENIEKTAADQRQMIQDDMEKYLALREDLSTIKTASTGAVVVMEVDTGKVLASASYPSFDNNDFIVGISSEEYKQLYGEDNPDRPMINRVIGSKTMPGSIFKMATGWAGLQQGAINTETRIDDEGLYSVATNPDGTPNYVGAPKCWTRLDLVHDHSDQNITKALKNSCNYFFFKVADETKIANLTHWISQLGLDSPTGIELSGEVVGRIGGQQVLFDNTKEIREDTNAGMVKRALKRMLIEYCELANIRFEAEEEADERIGHCAESLMRLVDDTRQENQYGPAIREIMQTELGIPQVLSNSRSWSRDVASMLFELRWNRSQTVRTGIGQAVVEVTPIAAARYVAALVNGGTVYNASIVDRVIDKDGKTIKQVEPSVFGKLDTNPEYLAAIKEGMHQVFSEEDTSTAARFQGFQYIEQMGGKTGTAQIRAQDNVDIENTSWLVTFVPYDKPEIVIVTCIPNGYAGAYSDTVVKRIVSYYMERKETTLAKTVTEHNGLLD